MRKSFFCLVLCLASLLLESSFAQNFARIEPYAISGTVSNNSGIGVADYDQDGYLDIFISKHGNSESSNSNTLLKNMQDGTFENVTIEAGLQNSIGGNGVSWADYDNDGDSDLFLTGISENQLYQNNSDGTFTNVSAAAGLDEFCSVCVFESAVWWDYDYDGDLDLYITAYFVSPIQYRNNGDGTFTKTELGSSDEGAFSFGALPMDFNNDQILDLYVANDLDLDNFLFINDKTDFTESANVYGVENPFDGMGLAVCDYDNNGYFDFGVTNISENGFFAQDENGFSDIAKDVNLYNTGWAWGIVFSDFDLDGFEDSFIVNGFNDKTSNHLFKNVSAGDSRTFQSISENLDSNEDSESRGIVSFDFDNDGDLDILVTNVFDSPHFFENLIDETSDNNYAFFSLEGTSSNKNGFGATISIETSEGSQYRLAGGVGFLSQSVQPIHFGLGAATSIDVLKIEWPSGIIDEFADLSINSHILLTEGNGYEILTNKPVAKTLGCTDQLSCNYDPSATKNNGTCVYLEKGAIDGANTSYPLQTETYAHTSAQEYTDFEWIVTNGEIISGDHTSSIEVKWQVAQQGTVSVVVADEQCSSQKLDFNVSLGLAEGKSKFEDHSIARLWNEVLLEAIRNDFARPTVHARNLFHSSIAMYDIWAIYNNKPTYLIGNKLHDYNSSFTGFKPAESIGAIDQSLSYAMYALLNHRFANSPGVSDTRNHINLLMDMLGYEIDLESIDYSDGDPIALGNYVASEIIAYGLQDGSNEESSYANEYYETVNSPLDPTETGNPTLADPNRWQPLTLEVFIDQSGNVLRENVPRFLSPEWGNALPFALTDNHLNTYQREENEYKVFLDPGAPPKLSISNQALSSIYQWGFSLVSVWAAHLSPNDGVMWDISPKSIGNIAFEDLPTSFENYDEFYNLLDGGDIGTGRSINPITNQTYETQEVPRGDYARVLAEFWADGPDSETPPGHWFTLLNYVSDHPMQTYQFQGDGDPMEKLEWDIKSYFVLGGAMHDAAISAWSVKGWHDYIRPISAIRFMADQGQSSNEELSNYSLLGIPLIEGYIELVEEGDPLAGDDNENVGDIKLYTWRGHDYIGNVETDEAGVGWILAGDWWPYQRPSFITPPFAGYVSGHSTFSRAAAEALTLFTGSEYFPGGLGEFVAKKNQFLVFEEGPSQDVVLQWATYRDASDQCSLSRIWGGIHPPLDDINGRLMGKTIGETAFEKALNLFNSQVLGEQNTRSITTTHKVYPNPTSGENLIKITDTQPNQAFEIIDIQGKVSQLESEFVLGENSTIIKIGGLKNGLYIISSNKNSWKLLID